MKILFFYTPGTADASQMELMLASFSLEEYNLMDAGNIGMIISYQVHVNNMVIVIDRQGHQKRMISPAEVNEWVKHVQQVRK